MFSLLLFTKCNSIYVCVSFLSFREFKVDKHLYAIFPLKKLIKIIMF